MTSSSRQFHLGLYLMPPVTHHSIATWKHELNMTRGFEFDRPEIWQHVARVAERGYFDFVFLADSEQLWHTYRDDPGLTVKHAGQVPCFDQTVLLSFMAAATERIGMAVTLSTVSTHPYVTSRRLATLDHLSRGRAAWNVVAPRVVHFEAHGDLPHDERYDRADEYLELCYRLWDSWDEDAVVLDVDGDTFADPAKVHDFDHHGRYYRSEGALNVHRPPQGRPVIAQAGQSPRGIRFAAKHAEMVFTLQPFREGMVRYHRALKSTMVDEFGRDPDDLKIYFGFQPIVGETEEAAREKAEYHNSLITTEGGLVMLSAHTGFDFSQVDPDSNPDDLDMPFVRSIYDAFKTTEEGRDMTIGEVARAYGRGVGTPQVVGTAEQIADWMQETMEEVGGDGFMLSPIYLPGSVEEFVDKVVPELQRRGLTRTSYVEGGTLRDNVRAF